MPDIKTIADKIHEIDVWIDDFTPCLKAAGKREESHARMSFPEREQARP